VKIGQNCFALPKAFVSLRPGCRIISYSVAKAAESSICTHFYRTLLVPACWASVQSRSID